ncbi:unnamed protein product [Phyllotreta striolata]|uniref:Uncharacterized protein n=1 Tax=Phyllotreta striolata TaxID=444603 RepID=A0A9N9TI69_PHYSR|nr:unnamed protein product [Phyllotreta striolata]
MMPFVSALGGRQDRGLYVQHSVKNWSMPINFSETPNREVEDERAGTTLISDDGEVRYSKREENGWFSEKIHGY